ncbi:hypothetical protein [Dolichospermum compactum]|uniref:Uncharacterized protein n=1 Tax=Dolichospermum compactum NIES-806 TaxID=1973481 RepID=A0A1Z4V678_9CYAN|nr:hypothetical protein [Dolichospermum compactum]BAZ86948.1 hypothetical protein NIES806_31660 [Dolichospermum compactum NIES-806]
MSILILILTQIIFLLLVLRVIFSLLDRVIEAYRKTRSIYQPKWGEMQESKKSRDKKNKRLSQIKRQSSNSSSFSGRQWNKLLLKVQGDIPTAKRLINNLKIKHPGKSDRWYIEKAIFDLERDKGRY